MTISKSGVNSDPKWIHLFTKIRCPVDEMGSISVTPSTIPKMIALTYPDMGKEYHGYNIKNETRHTGIKPVDGSWKCEFSMLE
jgi:hypothetical protein